MGVSMTGVGVRQQYGCFDTHTFIQLSTYVHGHPNPLTPKILFLLGFRPLYFENVGLLKKITCVKKKVAEIS